MRCDFLMASRDSLESPSGSFASVSGALEELGGFFATFIHHSRRSSSKETMGAEIELGASTRAPSRALRAPLVASARCVKEASPKRWRSPPNTGQSRPPREVSRSEIPVQLPRLRVADGDVGHRPRFPTPRFANAIPWLR